MAAGRKRGHGEGSVFYSQSRARWFAEVDYGIVNGRRKRTRRSFTTRREAAVHLAAALRAQAEGLPAPDGRTRLDTFVDHWLQDVVVPSTRARATVASYENAVRVHIKPALGHHRLIDLRHEHVLRFLSDLRDGGSGRSLMNTVLVVLRMALKQAIVEERLTRNVARDVAVPAPKTPAAVTRRLTRAERDALLAAARKDRLFGLYYVMYALGLRRGEAIGLQVDDADFDNSVLHVRQQIVRVTGHGLSAKLPKGEKTRSLYMSETTARILRERLTARAEERGACGPGWQDSELLFTTSVGTALDPSRLNHHMTDLCKSAGLSHATPHALRRTFSDDAHALGVADKELQQALGHTRIGMTMDTYVSTKPITDEVFASIIDSSLPDLSVRLADDLADRAVTET